MSTHTHPEDPYAGTEQMWSGDPNGGIVAEVTGLAPGRAIDVGCGEGADAVWLAGQGWQVTGVDVSPTALERAAKAADAANVQVQWLRAPVSEVVIDGGVDLVTLAYPALDRGVEGAVLDLVAPGGHLVALFHDAVDRERALAHGFDPDTLVDADVLRAALTGWQVVTDELRERSVTGGGGAHHHRDVVLHAVRPA